ncbi:hypothetical protein FRB94_003460 [Tulasnella sp. JGI-2019a]|nr:hypothetical protein FRB94_003460 [Tulasnella sp. JGI-2019a]
MEGVGVGVNPQGVVPLHEEESTSRNLLPASSVPLHLSTSDAHLIVIPDPTRSVGGGGFCDLFLGTYVPTGQKLAMKRPKFSTHVTSQVTTRRIVREANIWSSFKHDNILSFYGLVEISNETYLVSPWMEYGSLSGFVAQRLSYLEGHHTARQHNDPRNRAYMDFKEFDVIRGIASGLAYLHEKSVVHGDLKALNVLLTGQLEPLICDFGLTKMKEIHNATSTVLKGAGSWRWMSPELMNGGEKTMASDIYALGMTIVEVLTGAAPLPGLFDVPLIRAILDGQRPPCEPSFLFGQDIAPLWSIASSCWVSDPSKRPTARAICKSYPARSVSLQLSTNDARWIVFPQQARPRDNNGIYDLFLGTFIPTGLRLAMKRLRPSTAADTPRILARYAKAWSHFEHDNIVPFYGVMEVSKRMYLVSPWMEYGSLSRFIVQRLSFLYGDLSHQRDDPRRRAYMDFRESDIIHGIASGLAYLHKRDVVHGDLKASNILLTEQLKPLICDFGLTDLDVDNAAMMECDGWRWTSPELMNGGPRTMESDIYAFGMTIVELLTGSAPFPSSGRYSFIRAIIEGRRPAHVPSSRLGQDFAPLWSIASACWESTASNRPTAQTLSEGHPRSVSLRLSTSDAHFIAIPNTTRPVGGGGFGELFLGQYVPTGQRLAIKRLKFSTPVASHVAARRIASDAKTWSHFRHENILPFYGVVKIRDETCVVSQWMDRGSLSTFLADRLSFLGGDLSCQDDDPRKEAYIDFRESDVIHGIASGLAYLHDLHVVHGNLRASNVLLNSQLNPLVCDFGLTKMEDIRNATSTTIHFWRWMSPETMTHGPETFESDIYAFSMTIVEVLTGSVPLPDLVQVPFIFAILNGQRPSWEPPSRLGQDFASLWGIASACWVSDPSKRPTAPLAMKMIKRPISRVPSIFHIPTALPPVRSRLSWLSLRKVSQLFR